MTKTGGTGAEQRADTGTVTATSEDGVTVSVNAGGALTALEIDEAKAPPVAEIAASVLRTLHAAQAKLNRTDG